nr:PREDICTED: uncharacterized protein LOC109033021 isoform X1 [Bemisia tabaci]
MLFAGQDNLMDLNREEVRFVNRRILPSHVAKYKFLFHDSLPNGGVLSKYQNGGSKTSVDEPFPYKLSEQPSVFFVKNASSAMFEGGGDADDYGGNYGGNYNNDNYGGNYGGDSNATANSNSNSYGGGGFFSSQEQERDSRTSRLADVETYTYSDYSSATLPLNGRSTQSTPEAPVIVEQPRAESEPPRDDIHPSTPSPPEGGPNTNPYLESDLAIHHSEDSPIEDKITTFDAECGCPEILNADSLNNRDNDNNDGSAFHELSALNQYAAEKQTSSADAKEDSCGMDCLYFTLQCCECAIL